MQMEGVPPQELVRLHGELLAHEWLEQNTGVVVRLAPGAVPCCYRATRTGHRALAAATRPREEEEFAGATEAA
jgi:hypothetical protein